MQKSQWNQRKNLTMFMIHTCIGKKLTTVTCCPLIMTLDGDIVIVDA